MSVSGSAARMPFGAATSSRSLAKFFEPVFQFGPLGVLRRTFLSALLTLAAVITANAQLAYRDLHDCTSQPDGYSPLGGVSFDTAGNLYGTTTAGGTNGGGTLWKMTPSGDYTFPHEFGGTLPDGKADGTSPDSGVSFDSAGNLYGTTYGGGGGYSGAGIVWEMTVNGEYIDLHHFGATLPGGVSDGDSPDAGVSFDSAGNLYGTTAYGGKYGAGIVWELTPAGAYSDLHDFGGQVPNQGTDGSNPSGNLSFDGAGNLYGTTANGGSVNAGIVWMLTPSRSYSVRYNFGGQYGVRPSGVSLDAERNLYGTTLYGGAFQGNGFIYAGDVWEITASGNYRVLHNFAGDLSNGIADGAGGEGVVSLDAAGNLFGTTFSGGAHGGGVVWELTFSGTYSVVWNFGDNPLHGERNGANPAAGVSLDSAGNLYGTTFEGGTRGLGTIWQLGPQFRSLVFKPNPVTAGDTFALPTVTVELTGTVPTQTQFTLTSGSPAIADDILVTVPVGSSVGTGTVTTYNFAGTGETSVRYATTATASGASTFAGRLYIYPDAVKSIVFNPSTVVAGTNANAVVTVTASTVNPQSFNLTFYYNGNVISTVPVTVPGGQTSTTVSVPTPYSVGATPKVYELSGNIIGANAHGFVTVVPNSVTNLTLACANSGSGAAFSELDTVQASVTLGSPAPSGATIPITCSLNGIISPFTITVAPGASTGSATFTPNFTALLAPRTAKIYAQFGTVQSQTVTIYPEIESLTLNPSTINGGQSTTGTITLFDPAPPGSTVTAIVHSTTATLAPGTNPIAITGGGTTYTFTINALPRFLPADPVPAIIQITGLGYSRSALLTINPT